MPNSENLEQKQSVSEKTKQSLYWFTILPPLLHVIRFANSIILARILSPEDFGIVGIATVLLYFSNSIADFGFSNAIIQRRTVEQRHYDVYFTYNLGISILLYCLFSFYSEGISQYFHSGKLSSAIDVVILLFLISALVAIPRTSHRRNINFKILALAEAVKVFVSIAISLPLALLGFEFMAIVFAMVVSNLAAMLLTRLSCTIQPRLCMQFSYLKDLVSFGVWDFLWGQSTNLCDNVDKIIIGRILDTAQLGLFEKAQGLAKMPNEQFSNRLGAVSFSTFSRVQDNKASLADYFSKLMSINAFICFPLYFGLCLVAEDFTLVLLGAKWSGMIEPLKILSISFLVASLSGPLVSINIAMGQVRQQTLIRIAGLGVLVPMLILFVPYGIIAVSYVILSFNLFLFVASFSLLSCFMSIPIKKIIWFLYPAFVCSVLLLLAIGLVGQFFSQDSRAVNLLIEVLTGLITYGLCFILVPFEQWKPIRSKAFKILKKLDFKLH
jgi:O-antigen/teichoic acid export membrane protein